MFSLNDYNYNLPPSLIAQQPAVRRDRSNLLALNRDTGELSHHCFNTINGYLKPGDVLVINNTAVIPARLKGKKETGGKVEVLISEYASGIKSLEKTGNFVCRCIVKASKRPRIGMWLRFAENLKAEVLDTCNETHTLKFYTDDDFESLLDRLGNVPLPPYIKRNSGRESFIDDKLSYQTVYASHKGAIAAPTAGLHFTGKLLDKLKTGGVKIAALTLHVGYGTFLPVRSDDIRKHQMHPEQYTISEKSAEIINSARDCGGRVVAVGTTCVRALEYAADSSGGVAAGNGSCDLFIFPGYRFKAIDAMLTNFHLPKSTLLMLVSAFAGREKVLKAYREAIKMKYRFYSYGDAMFIY
jgi:S-adenosylmethionine:tRNA ribosyltransferase-isomerase